MKHTLLNTISPFFHTFSIKLLLGCKIGEFNMIAAYRIVSFLGFNILATSHLCPIFLSVVSDDIVYSRKKRGKRKKSDTFLLTRYSFTLGWRCSALFLRFDKITQTHANTQEGVNYSFFITIIRNAHR